jgi:DNA-binding FadR family transcriptional regulator
MFKAVKTRRVFEDIASQIRSAILQGQLGPGDKLPPETELAHEFGVGRPAIREAMRTLEISGLINVRHGKQGGAYVQDGNLNSLRARFSDLLQLGNISLFHLTEARLPLETSMFDLMQGKITAHKISSLRQCIETSEELYKEGKEEERIKENLAFHVHLAMITENPLIIINVSTITGLMRCFLFKIRPNPRITSATMSAHSRIVEYLETSEFEKAKEINRHHIMEVTERLVRKYRSDSTRKKQAGKISSVLKEIYIQQP